MVRSGTLRVQGWNCTARKYVLNAEAAPPKIGPAQDTEAIDMTPHSLKRTTIILAALVIVSACSVTDYTPAVTKFSEATENSERALVGLDQKARDIRAAWLQARVLAGGGVDVQMASGECDDDSSRCRLMVVVDGVQTEFLVPESPIPDVLIVMAEIRRYANNLSALINADTAAKASASVNAALGSIEELAKTLNNIDPTKKTKPIKAFATPVGQATTWLIGQYVVRVKLKGLKRATKAADGTIADAANVFRVVEGFVTSSVTSKFSEDVELVETKFDDNRTSQNLRRWNQSAEVYDKLLRASAADIFGSMAEAHNALTQRLQNDKLSLASALAKIEAFAMEAEKLAKIIEGLSAIGNDSN